MRDILNKLDKMLIEEYDPDKDPLMFKGKQIDTKSINYKMQDISDQIYDLQMPMKYTDGTELTDDEFYEIIDNDDLNAWIINDYTYMMDDLNEVSRAESNKVNAMLSKVLGNINFTHFFAQKGGMFKLPPNVKHEVVVDSNDMKDAADLLMKDDGDIGFMFKQGQIRLVPAMQKESKDEINEGSPANNLLVKIDNMHSRLKRAVLMLPSMDDGDLTDQVTTMMKHLNGLEAVIKRSVAIIPEDISENPSEINFIKTMSKE